ncbi:hypothetical protein GCM10011505_03180 [Tistrella bauzanensis]|uniref:Macro domain-containing protein n=2 Tax=Tistrella bauzanensis TaxID=657419 RepID=A0ABQ1I7T2_9PROT|nr:hypothetical protein GCM10011505_03180 [Tistrella bauzanensis]
MLLVRLYTEILAVAMRHEIVRLALPPIGTRSYGIDPEFGARTALAAVSDHLDRHPDMEIVFCLVEPEQYDIYDAVMRGMVADAPILQRHLSQTSV